MYLVLLINQSDPYCGGDFEFVKKKDLLDFIKNTIDKIGELLYYNTRLKSYVYITLHKIKE